MLLELGSSRNILLDDERIVKCAQAEALVEKTHFLAMSKHACLPNTLYRAELRRVEATRQLNATRRARAKRSDDCKLGGKRADVPETRGASLCRQQCAQLDAVNCTVVLNRSPLPFNAFVWRRRVS